MTTHTAAAHPRLDLLRLPDLLYPMAYTTALVDASVTDDQKLRIQKIDAITDELARIGKCRARRADAWQPAHVVAAEKLRRAEVAGA